MSSQKTGIYIHIPFCIQRCHYCDFATYSKDQIKPNTEYVDTVLLEAQKRRSLIQSNQVDSIYFGGGTPSLLEAHEIERIIVGIKRLNFSFSPDIETTIEVNPATLTEQKCIDLKTAGINRVSIGCQSFNDDQLTQCNREHNVQDTMRTIELAQKHFNNFSLDLLFSLPKQSIKELNHDLKVIESIKPPHVSAYCLTVPENHPMNKGRASDEAQVEMFSLIKNSLLEIGLERYEISNFAKPGFESVHNNIYWTDHSYWGLGLSAHSYLNTTDWGHRFWNPSSYQAYMKQIQDLKIKDKVEDSFSPSQYERLSREEALTDFCHTHMRLSQGLSEKSLRHKFSDNEWTQVKAAMMDLLNDGLVIQSEDSWTLTEKGVLLSNHVFSKLLFS